MKSFAKWSEEVSDHMVKECFRFMAKQGTEVDKIRFVSRAFLYKFVTTLLIHTLDDVDLEKMEKEEDAVNKAVRDFSLAKSEIQFAISEAFSHTMSDFSGEEVEYYCDISPFETPINTKPI